MIYIKDRRIAERRQPNALGRIMENSKGFNEQRWHERRYDGIELPDDLFKRIASTLKCHSLRPVKLKLGVKTVL